MSESRIDRQYLKCLIGKILDGPQPDAPKDSLNDICLRASFTASCLRATKFEFEISKMSEGKYEILLFSSDAIKTSGLN